MIKFGISGLATSLTYTVTVERNSYGKSLTVNATQREVRRFTP